MLLYADEDFLGRVTVDNDETRFLLAEHWESQAALDVHRTATAYTTIYFPQVLPLVNREPHPCTLLE